MKKLLFSLFLLVNLGVTAQNYTSYHTGNVNDVTTTPEGGICLMGGASEDDEAMKWFLQRANGGDVLVLRTSGSDGYNNYMFSSLGITINSVETIVCNNAQASNDIYVQQKVAQAEAIWFAGGDQWDYISYWRNTVIDSIINDGIDNRNIVIGGTSAGMAIQGRYYFSAQNGTVTSPTALSNPFDSDVTVDSNLFLNHTILSEVITDTHFDNPDRKGRLVTFMARMLEDYGVDAKGIACDEYTAVCIDTTGVASVYGGFPTYDDNAYFIRTNCELPNTSPEDCTSGNPLEWNLNSQALKVYKVKGTSTGSNTFDLNNWETGIGGTWENWFIDNGSLYELASVAPNCSSVGIEQATNSKYSIFPNPVVDVLQITGGNADGTINISDLRGKTHYFGSLKNKSIDVSSLASGVYIVNIAAKQGSYQHRLIKN